MSRNVKIKLTYLKVRLSLPFVRSLRTIRGRFRRYPVGIVPPLCTSQLKPSPPPPPPPGQRGDLTLTAVKSYQMPHPLGPNFLSKWIKMRQTPQGLRTEIKKKWKIANILAKQIPISKQALLALFILAWFLQIKLQEAHPYNMYASQKIHSFSKQRANIQRDIKRSKYFMV